MLMHWQTKRACTHYIAEHIVIVGAEGPTL